ncbi:hypothetical protein BJ322DRAFT_227536 [Thelephora terrestris]|uniref:DUF7598 domain-containing protein n=1 Tax=Thelephora terrestris TaxID=56493 RepID=A0A9P6HAF0_9AGAM|nr:hypothetical protein BJ322DRAFT_227536 [Thelephora terrestris]
MPSSRAIFFFSLNAIRVIGIISLILVFASSILVMVMDINAVNTFLEDAKASGTPVDQLLEGCDYIENSTVPNQTGGIFWAVVNQLLIITQVVILILSECSWPMSAFDRFFPVLGTGFGLGPLGIFECLIGATILSHFVDDFALVSAFFLFSIGCLNILLGLVFGVKAKQKRSIRAWRSDSDDVLPPIDEKRPAFTRPDSSYMASFFKPSEKAEFGNSPANRRTSGLGFGKSAEKAAGLKGFLISKPLESLPNHSSPRYQPRTTRSRPSSGSSIYSTSSANAPVPQYKPSYNAV